MYLRLIAIFFLISCSRYQEITHSKIKLNIQALSTNDTVFLAGIKNNEDSNDSTIWIDKITSTDEKLEKELATGDWTFYGRAIVDGKELCSYTTETLIGEIQSIEIDFNSSNCNNKLLSSSTDKDIQFHFCQDISVAKSTGCDGLPGYSKSFRISYYTVESSNLSAPEISTSPTYITKCHIINNSSAEISLPFSPQTDDQLPMYGSLEVYKDEKCKDLNNKVDFNNNLYVSDTSKITQASFNNNQLIFVADSQLCQSDSDCDSNYFCSKAGACMPGIGEKCAIGDCFFGSCESGICETFNFGISCDSPNDCASEQCMETTNTCSCSSNDHCQENYQCSTIGTCQAPLGITCQTDTDCILGNCENGLCLPIEIGESCQDNDECASGYCESGTCAESSLFFSARSYTKPIDLSGGETGDNAIVIENLNDKTAGIAGDTDFSFSLWFKTNQKNRANLFGQKSIAYQAPGQIGLAINGPPYGGANIKNQLRFNMKDANNSNYVNVTIDLADHQLSLYEETWNHIAITRQEDKTEESVHFMIYFNGVTIYEQTYAKGDFPIPDNQRLHIGSRYLWTDTSKTSETKASFFVGAMDEFAVFDSALSMTEVKALYADNRVHDLRYPFSSYESNAGLKTYLKMNKNPFDSTTDLVTYFRDGDHQQRFIGTMTSETSSEFTSSPNTFLTDEANTFTEMSYQQIPHENLTSTHVTCHNTDHPPTRATDGDLTNFSHTLQGCGTQEQYFTFLDGQGTTVPFYVAKFKIHPRGGADKRLRNIDTWVYAHNDYSTPLLKHSDVVGNYINNQVINNFNPAVDWVDSVINVSSLVVDYIQGKSFIYENDLIVDAQTQSFPDNNLFYTDRIQLKRIPDSYYDPNGNGSQQIDDKKVLQMGEFIPYGMSSGIYDDMVSACQNGVRNFFETDVDCGGTFCPAALLSGSCLGGKHCLKNSDCLSGECDKNTCTQSTGYNSDGDFTAKVSEYSLLSSDYDTTALPQISVSNEIGLTTQLCEDKDCDTVLGEVEHIAQVARVIPDSGLADGAHTFYFRVTNGIDYGEITGPLNYHKFTASKIANTKMEVIPSSTWAHFERSKFLTDGLYNDDFNSGTELDNNDSNGENINDQQQHYVDIILEKPTWISEIKLTNRKNCCFDRFKDINIELYDDTNSEIATYYKTNNNAYFTTNYTGGTLQGQLAEYGFDLTSSISSDFGLAQTKKVKRIRITRQRSSLTFIGDGYGEGQVGIGLSEIELQGYIPTDNYSTSLNAPSNYELTGPEYNASALPEISVTNDIGNRTILCEDSDCLSVIGWVDHEQETETFQPMVELPVGGYTFYFRSIKGSEMSSIVGSINFTRYSPSNISNNSITISAISEWNHQELMTNLIDGDFSNVGSTGSDANTNNTNYASQHWIELEFDEEKIINQISLYQRTTCCLDRIMDYNIILYNVVNGVETEVANYYTLNNRLFCEDELYKINHPCNYIAGQEIRFSLDSSNPLDFGLSTSIAVTKIKITRDRNTDQTIDDGGDEKHVVLGFNEIVIKGYVP